MWVKVRKGLRACPHIWKVTRDAVLRVSRARSVFPLPFCGLNSLQHRGHQDLYLKSCLGPQEHTHVHTNLHIYDHTLTHIHKPTCAYMLSCFSRVRIPESLWTIAYQALLSSGFSSQEHWSGLPCPPPGALPDQRIESTPLIPPALADRFFTTSTTWKTPKTHTCTHIYTGTHTPTYSYTHIPTHTHRHVNTHTHPHTLCLTSTCPSGPQRGFLCFFLWSRLGALSHQYPSSNLPGPVHLELLAQFPSSLLHYKFHTRVFTSSLHPLCLAQSVVHK